ncbi:hypothetical protein GCM10025866_28760 [Naasia aerilata]|uniref:DUF559 domain-containing protein n=2 Tax=Naasia aerilata TaxID=1162966 RepID=A0ABN6XSR1_9MICO|nr:hypothetical protein GCM10025866_28760 [Naasia aerilata]
MRRLEGVAHLQELIAAGFSRYQVAAMMRQGQLLRPRIGWYVAPWHSPDVVRAVRVGGRLTCVSAAASYGLPVPPDPRVHVCLPRNASRLRASSDGRRVAAGQDRSVVWHWSDTAGQRFRVDLVEALREASTCVPAGWFVGMVDAGRRPDGGPPLLPAESLEELRSLMPRDKRGLLGRSDPAAESVLESLMRVGLEDAGVFAETQVVLGSFRVDFLLDGWLVIECDGGRHHSGPVEFERDRRRDAALSRLGYRVLRFSYRQIVEDWEGVIRTVRSVLSGGGRAARIRHASVRDGVSS